MSFPFPLEDCPVFGILLLPLLVNRNGISVPQMITDTLQLLLELSRPFVIHDISPAL